MTFNVDDSDGLDVADGNTLTLRESSANGVNGISISAPASVGSDYAIRLPASAGTAGQSMTVASVDGSTLSLEFSTVSGGGGSTLAGLSDTVISSPAAGHVIVYDGSNSFDSVAISGDAALAANGTLTIWSSASVTLTHDNAAFDLGTNPFTAKLTALTGITIPAGALVTAVVVQTTEAFDLNTSSNPAGTVQIKIDGEWIAVKYASESYGYISESDYWITNSTRQGSKTMVQTVGGSSVNPEINVKSATNDSAYGSSGYLTDGTLVVTVYWR